MSPGAEEHRPVRELERLEDPLRVPRHGLELVVGGLGRRHLHELDLVELVLAEEAPRVLPVRPGLAAVARREGGVLPRQRLAREDLASVQRGQRHLGGRE